MVRTLREAEDAGASSCNSALLNADTESLANALRGCRDMLHEAKKQFRATGDIGHASMCDLHIYQADEALKGI